ncbi:MAG: SUMF1/EgtB/PvdO family nonheme iron enzyme, partial [Planctomycetota bacterium]|nr:SUMF1/EgtB/PvdO family nonheme iron enzyme [Planctomycetota bacterium]
YEDEWEFACRAGGNLKFGFVDTVAELAKYSWASEGKAAPPELRRDHAHPVAQKTPNPFGLHDMMGNVAEWLCVARSTTSGPYFVTRGGAFFAPAASALGQRDLRPGPLFTTADGFRLVRDLPMKLEDVPKESTEAERWVAKWLLERGTNLSIRSGAQTREVATTENLPQKAFSVESLTLGPDARFQPAELAYLQRLPNLTVLRLANRGIIDRAAARLVGFNKLTELQVSACPISPAGWAYLAKNETVRTLTFSNMTINDQVLATFPGFKNLEGLDLSGQPITDTGLKHVGSLKNLRRLLLTGTAIGDAGLKHLAGLRGLTELNLASTRVTDAGLSHLAGCEALETLDLSRTAVAGSGLAPLARLRRLATLNLSFSKLTDEGSATLGRLAALRTLNVCATDVSDAGIRQFQTLTDLRELNVNATRISDAGLVAIGKLGRIAALQAANTTVSDLGIDSLRTLTDLSDVALAFSRVGDGAVDIFVRLPNLQHLSLRGTYITDACIDDLALLRKATTIDLDYTNIKPESATALRARLSSCHIDVGEQFDPSRELHAVYIATYFGGNAFAKIRWPNGATQTVRGQQLKPPFHVLELSAEGSNMGDGVLNDVRFLKAITLLNLKNARISNRGVQDLAGLKTLETLILDANPIADSALPHLYGLAALRFLSLKATRVTPEGVQGLMDKLPQCRVESDFFLTRIDAPWFPQSSVTQPAAIAGLRSWTVLPVAHRDLISAVACSATGDLIAIAGDDGAKYPATIRVWGGNAAEEKPGFSAENGFLPAGLRVLFGHEKKIEALAWSPNGKYLASTGQDMSVKFWEPSTGRNVRTFVLNSPGLALAWSPTTDHMAVACAASVALISIKDGEIREIASTETKGAIAWAPDGKRFLVQSYAGNSATLTVYDATTLEVDRSIQTAELSGKSATWSPDGKQIAATYADKLVRIWDVATCERVQELTAEPGEILHVAWSPTGDRLATMGASLIIWDAAKGERLASAKLNAGPGLSWTANGKHIAVCLPGAVEFYNAADGTLTDTLAVTGVAAPGRLAISPDGHYRPVGSLANQVVYVALTDDYRQETYTPAAFAAKFGWKNDFEKARLFDPRRSDSGSQPKQPVNNNSHQPIPAKPQATSVPLETPNQLPSAKTAETAAPTEDTK